MTQIDHSEDTPLRIHSNTDYDYAMRVSFIKGCVHTFNRLLNYCSKNGNKPITYDQIHKAKEKEIRILRENLKDTQATVIKLNMEAKDRIEFKEWQQKKKDKKRLNKDKKK